MQYIIDIIKQHGIGFFLNRGLDKLFKRKVSDYKRIASLFKGKSGIEIGGPSSIFTNQGYIPLYNIIEDLDGCNFSTSTIWEGDIVQGSTYSYTEAKNGFQYISEASDLSGIQSEKYDFLISSNCLEHIANPLKAVEEWLRVLRDGGTILLVLPNKKFCFDHRRPYTQFEHLYDDYMRNTTEDDMTHLEEILQLHDLKMDKPAGTPAQFKKRSLENFKVRALHHHVFSLALLIEVLNFFKIEVLHTEDRRELIIIGKKHS